MAQKTIVRLTDDLDGQEADETVRFGLDGAAYEIDLCEDNATNLRESLAPFILSARRAGRPGRGGDGGTTRAARRGSQTADGGRTAQIRDWGRSNGFTVSDRGRIAGNIVDAYERAHA